MQIAATGGAKVEGASWRVTSQVTPGRKYRVNPRSETCTCPDHEETNGRCKHVWAVIFTMTAEQTPDGEIVTTQRVTYAQDWSSYNRAQCEEKESFMRLLADLCSTIPQPEQANGRPRLPLSDMVFAACFKVFSGFSSRRFASDLRDAHEKGLISRVPHFNSVTNYMADPALTPLLQDLIAQSALPLRAIESDFAVDSTGFTSTRFKKWLDEKHGIGNTKKQRDWLKAHVMVGVRTNVVTSVEISGGFGADTSYFDGLVRDTAKGFDVEEVSADKAYLTKSNVETVEEIGAVPFIPFKKNTKPVLGIGSAWARMYHRFAAEPETFDAHYHKRSNVETTFSMIKGKFGDSVLSKSPVGQANEVLCKVLAHNIVCVAQAAIEYGIDPAASRVVGSV